jgi:PAS domain S-box-containing protein
MPSIKLQINSYKEAINNKHLVEIIDWIISSFPITFVNLERLRKDIDALDELFWLKDEEGKYLLVNNKFASSLHLIPSQIEGKHENNFIPAYLINFSKALDEYIKESRNVFIIEGFAWSGLPAGESYQTIKIPVPGSEGDVSAIIGVAQKRESVSTEQISLSSILNPVKPFVKNYILIDKNGLIKDISEEFCNILSLKPDRIKESNFKNTLPVLITKIIEDFINSTHTSQEIELENLGMLDRLKLHLHKGNDKESLIFVETLDTNEPSQKPADNDAYDLAVQNIPEPVFIYDKENLRFLQANNEALKLYGYRKDEFLQLDLTDLYTPEDIQTLLEGSDEKFKEGTYSKPYRQKKKDGSTIFVEINRNSIKYKDIKAFLIVVRDVTNKLQLEKEGQHFKAAFNSSDILFFITDKEGFIKSFNNAVIEALGYSARSILETSLAALVIDKDRGKINSSVFQSVSKDKLVFNTFLKKAGNEFLEVKLISNPVFDYNGQVDSYNIICSVVQEKVREVIKEVIKEVVKEVPAENSSNKEYVSALIPEIKFLSGVFHDLLTPINVIIGFVQEFTENIEQPTSEQLEAIEIINQSKANLLNSMNLIIEFIQLEKNETELKYETVKIIDIIEDVKTDIETNKITGDGELAFGKISSSLEIKTDAQKMRRLLTLLVKIIIKITGEKKLYISAQSSGEQNFTISFKDGYNSATESFIGELKSVFSDNTKIPGNGISSFVFNLGKILLSLLGGEFKYREEKEKKDTAFIFPLNLEEIKAESEVITDEITQSIEEAEEEQKEIVEESGEKDFQMEISEVKSAQNIELAKLSCLYIEDQLDSQMLFSTQMKDLKEINFVVSFEQALPFLNTKHFDFIVVDINLQGDYNGLDILKIIRTMPDYENVPVIAVTAYLLPGDKERFIQAGFSDFVSKPVFREKIINSLEKIITVQA